MYPWLGYRGIVWGVIRACQWTGLAAKPVRNYSGLIHYGMIAGKGTCQNGTRLKGNYGSGGEGAWGALGFRIEFFIDCQSRRKRERRLPIESILDVSNKVYHGMDRMDRTGDVLGLYRTGYGKVQLIPSSKRTPTPTFSPSTSLPRKAAATTPPTPEEYKLRPPCQCESPMRIWSRLFPA